MIKVLIADDQELFSDLLGYMLANDSDIEIIGRVSNGVEAVQQSVALTPDVILMDLSMPICDGIEATRQIKALNLNSRIIILTSSNDGSDAKTALELGADGYVLKSISKERLILAIKSVYAGMEIIDRDISHSVNISDVVVNKGKNNIIVRINDIDIEITNRELQIITMIVDGKSTIQMSQELFLTEGRIRNIITDLISKLMLKDRTQLAVFALKNKLIK